MRRQRRKKYIRTESVLPILMTYDKGCPTYGCPHCYKQILDHEKRGLRRCYRCLNWVDTSTVKIVDRKFQFPYDFDWLSETSILFQVLPKTKGFLG